MSLFEVYKPNQGKYVRLGTLITIGVMTGFGMYWLGGQVLTNAGLWVQTIAVLTFGTVWTVAGLWLVNHPRYAEFMIMTESEMRKVNWPTFRVVMNSTKVVILMTLILSIILFLVDWGFAKIFEQMGLLTRL